MQIDIPPTEHQALAKMAGDAGYDSVECFVAEHILSLAHHSVAPMSEQELRASLEMCDRGMDEIDAGGGRDAREALLEIGRRRGYSLDV